MYAGSAMRFLRKLGVVFLFLTLELGALLGMPVPPEKIRELMDLMTRSQVTQVKRDEDGDEGALNH